MGPRIASDRPISRIRRAALMVAALLVAPLAQAAPPSVTMGPVFGGGSLAGLDLTVPLSEDVSLGIDVGLRTGLSIKELYANVAGGVVVAGELSRPGRSRHGLFATVGATAPLDFFEVWTGGGWHLSTFDARGLRQIGFDLGVAYYLVRELPPETDLRLPAFLYLRFVYHIPLIQPPPSASAATSG